ncbi:MAG: hypothetical protein CM15mP49_32220 [Actinomycetota bacterium]|nr:MAG: hypothetical protein CM15mP49_32220 [Actinomycetota bacterium]
MVKEGALKALLQCQRWCYYRSFVIMLTYPFIAAGGISDGRTMAAAFALGAEGVQMGTQMLSCLESQSTSNWKESIVNARETDTYF